MLVDYNRDWLNHELNLNESFYSIVESCIQEEHNKVMFQEDSSLLSEGISDSIKKFWKELKEKIKQIWNKFIVNVNALVKSNKSFLDKYKGKILSAELKDFEYEMYPYWNGASELQRTKIPAFNEGNSVFMESLADEDTFRQKYFPNFRNLDKDNDNLADALKEHFRGGEAQVVIKGSEMKTRIRGMIDYCLQYDSIINNVKRDYTNIEKSIEKAERVAARANNSISASESTNLFGSFEGLLYENGIEKELDSMHKSKKADIATSKANAGFKDNVDKSTKDIDKNSVTQPDNSTRDSASENLKRYRLYVTFCQKILGAKQTIYEERYKVYMSVLKKLAANPSSKSDGESANKSTSKPEGYDKLSDVNKQKVDKLRDQRNKLKTELQKYLDSNKSIGVKKFKDSTAYKKAQEGIAKIDASLGKILQTKRK